MNTAYIGILVQQGTVAVKAKIGTGCFVIGVKGFPSSLEKLIQMFPNIVAARMPEVVNGNYLETPENHTLQPAWITWSDTPAHQLPEKVAKDIKTPSFGAQSVASLRNAGIGNIYTVANR